MAVITKRSDSFLGDKRGSTKLDGQGNHTKQSNLLNQAVAVYGTLKRGKGNHPLLSEAMFVGTAKTKNKYPLVIRNWGLPFLINKPNVGYNVEVEIYLIDQDMLNRLDILEGHPDWYRRKRRKFILLEDGYDKLEMEAWVYFGPDENLDVGGGVYYERY